MNDRRKYKKKLKLRTKPKQQQQQESTAASTKQTAKTSQGDSEISSKNWDSKPKTKLSITQLFAVGIESNLKSA